MFHTGLPADETMLSSDNSKVWFVAHKSVFCAAKHLGQIHSEVVLPMKERHSLTKDFFARRDGWSRPLPLGVPRPMSLFCNPAILFYWNIDGWIDWKQDFNMAGLNENNKPFNIDWNTEWFIYCQEYNYLRKENKIKLASCIVFIHSSEQTFLQCFQIPSSIYLTASHFQIRMI